MDKTIERINNVKITINQQQSATLTLGAILNMHEANDPSKSARLYELA